ncbi:hypothetical protein LguiB_031461 [Lonicera macranthoides]
MPSAGGRRQKQAIADGQDNIRNFPVVSCVGEKAEGKTWQFENGVTAFEDVEPHILRR